MQTKCIRIVNNRVPFRISRHSTILGILSDCHPRATLLAVVYLRTSACSLYGSTRLQPKSFLLTDPSHTTYNLLVTRDTGNLTSSSCFMRSEVSPSFHNI